MLTRPSKPTKFTRYCLTQWITKLPVYNALFLWNYSGIDANNLQSTFIKVMAWCSQATSHYLSHCWSRSLFLCCINRATMGLCLYIIDKEKILQLITPLILVINAINASRSGQNYGNNGVKLQYRIHNILYFAAAALAIELRLSWTNPSIYPTLNSQYASYISSSFWYMIVVIIIVQKYFRKNVFHNFICQVLSWPVIRFALK